MARHPFHEVVISGVYNTQQARILEGHDSRSITFDASARRARRRRRVGPRHRRHRRRHSAASSCTRRLIAFDTYQPEGIRDAVAFIEGWIEANGIHHQVVELDGRPSVIATAGEGDRTIVWASHVNAVPGDPAQFTPRQRAGRLYGRGSYDMKGALAAMLAALADLPPPPRPHRECARSS